MFALERILRNFSESNVVIVSSSFYEEMISKIEEWRNEKIVDSEYHERLRLLVLPYLKESISKLLRLETVESSLKVFLFAHDHKIELTLREIDWTAVLTRLIESGTAENRGLTVRLVRYLRIKERAKEIEEISLLLTNTINKLLLDPSAVSFALQLLNLFPSSYFEDNPAIQVNLMKLLRSRTVNDRIKVMSVGLLKGKCAYEDVGEIRRTLGCVNSAGLMSVLGVDSGHPAPISSSKVINLLNGHYGQFSKVEQSILRGNTTVVEEGSNGYEEFLCSLVFDSLNGIFSNNTLQQTPQNYTKTISTDQ